jgi:hypothetical protein
MQFYLSVSASALNDLDIRDSPFQGPAVQSKHLNALDTEKYVSARHLQLICHWDETFIKRFNTLRHTCFYTLAMLKCKDNILDRIQSLF